VKRVLYLPLYRTADSPYKYMAIGGHDLCGGFCDSVEYFSKRYIKVVSVQAPYRSDGATSAPDIDSDAWWFHDVLCDRGTWDDGTPLTNWQCSSVLYDVMRAEKYNWFRCNRWRHTTFLFGGGKARDNGLLTIA
jgi:hypothetical protein